MSEYNHGGVGDGLRGRGTELPYGNPTTCFVQRQRLAWDLCQKSGDLLPSVIHRSETSGPSGGLAQFVGRPSLPKMTREAEVSGWGTAAQVAR